MTSVLLSLLKWGVIIWSLSFIAFALHLMFSKRHKSKFLEMGETNDLDKAKEMIEEDCEFAWNGFKILTNKACASVYNSDKVSKAFQETIKINKINPSEARVLVGPELSTEKGYNQLIEMHKDNQITVRQLNKEDMPDRHFRIFGPRVYIEYPHEDHPEAERKFDRVQNIPKCRKKYNQLFKELWDKSRPLDVKNPIPKDVTAQPL